mmetsp:Transcript_33434/g.105625  ORF Transcript_33434/g.105625 Transcript_33434/m.105625 type:complete len:388 (+) Transcript_33434:324-1487(+)
MSSGGVARRRRAVRRRRRRRCARRRPKVRRRRPHGALGRGGRRRRRGYALVRRNPLRGVVLRELARQLHEELVLDLGHGREVGPEFGDGHELHDVAAGAHAAAADEGPIVAVELLHAGEVRGAYAHDDHAHGQHGGLHERVDGVAHVVDHAVRDDDEHGVLVALRDLVLLRDGHRLPQDGREERRARERDGVEAAAVDLLQAGHAAHLEVAVGGGELEAVRDLPADAPAEAVHGEMLVAVVLLEDLADVLDGALVRIHLPRRHVVQRARVARRAVRGREVHGQHHGELEAALEVVHEGGHEQQLAVQGVDLARVRVALVPRALLLLDHGERRLPLQHAGAAVAPRLAPQQPVHARLEGAHVVVVRVLVKIPDLEAQGPVLVAVAELL